MRFLRFLANIAFDYKSGEEFGLYLGFGFTKHDRSILLYLNIRTVNRIVEKLTDCSTGNGPQHLINTPSIVQLNN